MRPRQQFTEQQRREVKQALKFATSREEKQRVQAILLRMEQGLHAKEIGEILGMHTSSIWKIHSRFFKEGVSIFKSKTHGGRLHENLSLAQERKLLKPFQGQAKINNTLIISSIKKAYEKAVAREVSLSTVYRMLKRHR
jgi:transposase